MKLLIYQITNIKCAKLFIECLRVVPADIPIGLVDSRASSRTVILPGLIDVHVHVREPGASHKEDWDTCTAAALAGGITTVRTTRTRHDATHRTRK